MSFCNHEAAARLLTDAARHPQGKYPAFEFWQCGCRRPNRHRRSAEGTRRVD
jgi:hypothetical protein